MLLTDRRGYDISARYVTRIADSNVIRTASEQCISLLHREFMTSDTLRTNHEPGRMNVIYFSLSICILWTPVS